MKERITVIQPSRGWVALRLNELWEYRELIYFLVWRDIKVRYKQTVLGATWAIIQPLFTMVVFTIFFGRLANMRFEGPNYALFAYTALVPWSLFASGLTQAADSLVGNANLIKKVYFPRLVVPIAAVLAGLIDFLLAFLVLTGMLIAFGVPLTIKVLALPGFLLLALISALGVGMWLSALNVQFRDVRYTLPFLTQLWLFSTPIAYPSSLLNEPWKTLYGLNPMAGVVEGFRWSLIHTEQAPGPMLLFSTMTALFILISGMYYFRRMEKAFADVV